MKRAVLLFAAATAMVPPAAVAQTVEELVGECEAGNDWCVRNRAKFIEEYPLALKGDYGAQRNVAYFLRHGGDGAVWPRPVLGCAWRIVIVAAGDADADASDTGNLESDCGALVPGSERIALNQARRLFESIYKRPLPDF